jgi:hypothetical protein
MHASTATPRVTSTWRAIAIASVALAGCANAPRPAPPPTAIAPAAQTEPVQPRPPASAAASSQEPRYRCDHDIEFKVRFDDGTAQIDTVGRGSDTLFRDAGGVTPQQSVYSSTSLRAEFGLGRDGREAVLHYASPPLEAHCVRQ